MAKAFEVKTMNVSVVIANMAGIESIAKIKSVISINTKTMKSGVAAEF